MHPPPPPHPVFVFSLTSLSPELSHGFAVVRASLPRSRVPSDGPHTTPLLSLRTVTVIAHVRTLEAAFALLDSTGPASAAAYRAFDANISPLDKDRMAAANAAKLSTTARKPFAGTEKLPSTACHKCGNMGHWSRNCTGGAPPPPPGAAPSK